MATKVELVGVLSNQLLDAGYDATTEEDIASMISSEVVVGMGGKKFNSKDPIGLGLNYVNAGTPIYVKKKDGDISRINQDRTTGKLQTQNFGDTYTPIPQPPMPGLFSRVFDWFAQIFGGRVDSCKQWDDYLAKKSELRETLATVKAVTGKVPKPATNALSKDAQLNNDNAPKPYIRNIPMDINLCSDIDSLNEFVQENDMSKSDKQVLVDRITTAEKIKKLSESPVKPECASLENTEKGFVLPAAKQPEPQSTSNGCWSVSLQSLLAYHGVDLTQQEIRNYRPDCSIDPNSNLSLAAQTTERDLISKRMNTNSMNEIADFSDLIHKTVDDVALHHIALGGEDAGVKESFKEIVTRALKEHNSPVSILHNSHYRTIVGIEGDNLLLLNPKNEYPLVNGKPVPTKEPISKYAYRNSTIMLDWLEKIGPNDRAAINDSLKENRITNILSRHEGVTTSLTEFTEKGAQITHDVVYPKSYDDMQKISSKQQVETDVKTNNVVVDNEVTNEPVKEKQAKVLTIKERQELDKKMMATSIENDFEYVMNLGAKNEPVQATVESSAPPKRTKQEQRIHAYTLKIPQPVVTESSAHNLELNFGKKQGAPEKKEPEANAKPKGKSL